MKVIALISCTDKEDKYVTNKSIEFHKYMGYEFSGRIRKCGYKFGNWYDLVYMEKQIGDYLPEELVWYGFDHNGTYYPLLYDRIIVGYPRLKGGVTVFDIGVLKIGTYIYYILML